MQPINDTYTGKQVKKDFAIQPTLNRKFWPTDDVLSPVVRVALLKIANQFMDSLKVELKVVDITFTGSMANFNYSSVSDVDLHIVADFSGLTIDQSLLDEYLALKKSHWNDSHQTLALFGHPVEIYVESKDALHTTTGLYSLLQNGWIKKPKPSQPKFDPDDVARKANYFKSLYKVLLKQYQRGDYQEVSAQVATLREKLRDMRKSGLMTGGEFSVENLTFKVLRRSGVIKKLIDLQQKSSDRHDSL
jgi:hypothetical protein